MKTFMSNLKQKAPLLKKVSSASMLVMMAVFVANTSTVASVFFFAEEPKMPKSMILKQK